MKRLISLLLGLAAALASALVTASQNGSATGTINGRIVFSDGRPAAHVTVAASVPRGPQAQRARTGTIDGVWVSWSVPNESWMLELRPTGSKLTGTAREANCLTTGGVSIEQGSVEGIRIVFSVKSPDGKRTITFKGDLNSTEFWAPGAGRMTLQPLSPSTPEVINFTRAIEGTSGNAPAGPSDWGIFGADGVRTFTVRQDVSIVRITQTDNDGRYRLENLPFGRYEVVTDPMDNPPIYFPGTTDRNAATTVAVAAGNESAGIDLIRPETTFRSCDASRLIKALPGYRAVPLRQDHAQ